MTYIWLSIQQVFYNIWQRKLRSFLAMFGVFWGSLSVVLLLALGQGYYQSAQKNIKTISDGGIYISPGTLSKNYRGHTKGQQVIIKLSDIMQLKKALPHIRWVSPLLEKPPPSDIVKNGRYYDRAPTVGVTEKALQILNLHFTPHSRFINPIDIKQKQRVAVIDYRTAKRIFPHKNALGNTVILDSIPFTIIGVTVPRNGQQSRHHAWMPVRTFIPYTTHIEIWGDKPITYFVVMPTKPNQRDSLVASVRQYFAHHFHYDPSDQNALSIAGTGHILQFFHWFFFLVQSFLAFCGIMTLSVGGIGVANILFLIVTERTAEIGLKIALGAERRHIMAQVLCEALIIVLTGGILGILTAGIIVRILKSLPLPSALGTPVISFPSIFITLGVLLFIATLAGWFPARRAARLTPVKALAF